MSRLLTTPQSGSLTRTSCLLALLSGILLALSFPKPGLSLLAWVAFVPLFRAVAGSHPMQALKLGFIAGFSAYAGIVY